MSLNFPYPWQISAWQRLSASFKSNELPHALLLDCPNGMGKTIFVRQAAALLLCDQGAKGLICNICKSCHLRSQENHPDFYQIMPEGKQIKIEQIRNLLTDLNQTPTYQYKVIVFFDAQLLNKAAANALLKTLEEPTQNTFFILSTNKGHLLPATIRSRCQQIKFDSFSQESLKSWLLAQKIAHEELDLLLILSEDAPFLALKMAKENKLPQGYELLQDLNDLILNKKNPITIGQKWQDVDVPLLIQWLFIFLKYMLLNDLKKTNINVFPEEYMKKLALIATKKNNFWIFQYLDFLIEINTNIQRGFNLNLELVRENIFNPWYEQDGLWNRN